MGIKYLSHFCMLELSDVEYWLGFVIDFKIHLKRMTLVRSILFHCEIHSVRGLPISGIFGRAIALQKTVWMNCGCGGGCSGPPL